MSSNDELTLDDLEAAINVIQYFVQKFQQSQSVLSRMMPRQNQAKDGNPFTAENVMRMVMEDKGLVTKQEPTPEPVLTPAELARMKKVSMKARSRKAGAQTQKAPA